MASHTVDWTGRWRGDADAVVRPADTEQVRGVVEAARAHRFALVPQGGNTGLVGGATPQGRRGRRRPSPARRARTRRRRPPDRSPSARGSRSPSCSGTPATAGLALPVDLGARDTATIGGMVATNAGGMHVLRYGAHAGAGARRRGRARYAATSCAPTSPGCSRTTPATTWPGSSAAARAPSASSPAPGSVWSRCPRRRSWRCSAFDSIADAVDALPVLRGRPALHAVEVMLAGGIDVGGRAPRRAVPPRARAPVRAPRRAGRRRPAARARHDPPRARPRRPGHGGGRRPARRRRACGAGGRRTRRRPPRTAWCTRPTSPCRSLAMGAFVERGGPRHRAAWRRRRSSSCTDTWPTATST